MNGEKLKEKITENCSVDLFSSIKNIDMLNSYDILQNSLRNINHNVGLLKYYASSNGKKNLKKMKNMKNKITKHRNSIYMSVNNLKFHSKNKVNKNNSNINLSNKPNNTSSFKNFIITKYDTNNSTTNANTTANIFTHTNFNSTPLDFSNIFINKNTNNKPNFLFTSTNIKKYSKNFSFTPKETLSIEKKTENNNVNSKNGNIKNIISYCSKKKFLEKFPQIISPKIKLIRNKSTNIKNNINIGKKNLISANWYMNARFKYTEYKYGIAEIQKYFMDLKAYGKREEEEIEKRKTFFDFAEEAIDEMNEEKYQKQLENIKKKHGIDVIKHDLSEEDKKNIIKKIINSKKLIINKKSIADSEEEEKLKSLSKILGEVAERQKNEKFKRNKVKNLILMCKNDVGLINHFHNKSMKSKH